MIIIHSGLKKEDNFNSKIKFNIPKYALENH
jgi:hypothetical protein